MPVALPLCCATVAISSRDSGRDSGRDSAPRNLGVARPSRRSSTRCHGPAHASNYPPGTPRGRRTGGGGVHVPMGHHIRFGVDVPEGRWHVETGGRSVRRTNGSQRPQPGPRRRGRHHPRRLVPDPVGLRLARLGPDETALHQGGTRCLLDLGPDTPRLQHEGCRAVVCEPQREPVPDCPFRAVPAGDRDGLQHRADRCRCGQRNLPPRPRVFTREVEGHQRLRVAHRRAPLLAVAASRPGKAPAGGHRPDLVAQGHLSPCPRQSTDPAASCRAYRPPSAINSSCDPCSAIRPSSSTTMRSALRMVDSR